MALPGLAAYFRAQSDEERGHAQLLMDFQVWGHCLTVSVLIVTQFSC